MRLEASDLIVEQAALGSYDERDGIADCARARLARSGVRDQTERVLRQKREIILDEGSEAPMQTELREPRIARLLEPEQQRCTQRVLAHVSALPVASLHSKGIEQRDPLHAHRRGRDQDAPQEARARQREGERDRQGRRWLALELDVEDRACAVEFDDAAGPDATAQPSDAELVTDGGAVNAPDVVQSAPRELHAPVRQVVFGKQQDQVHSPASALRGRAAIGACYRAQRLPDGESRDILSSAGSVHAAPETTIMKSCSMRTPYVMLAASLILSLQSGAARAVEGVQLDGNWFVIVHYTDSSTANPDVTRWEDRAWNFERKGTRLQWSEYPIVVFEDRTGRFERFQGNPRSRVLHAWLPNEAQQAELSAGPFVNQRGSKVKTLRGDDREGWRSAGKMMARSALAIGYKEDLTIEGLSDKPRFVREDVLGTMGHQNTEGVTEYQVVEVLDGGARMRGTYQKDGIRSGTFVMMRTPPLRSLNARKDRRSPNDKARDRAVQAYQEDISRRLNDGDPEAVREIREAIRAEQENR